MAEHLHIENFGPIAKADITIKKVTILIGRQGSGKSTIAKLYALFTWMEKSLMRHSLTPKYIAQYSRFQKKFCAYNNIDECFTPDTVLHFDGNHFIFHYQGGTLATNPTNQDSDTFNISKVMYVPAERNVLGCIDHPSGVKGLGPAFDSFAGEFAKAKKNFKSGYHFPFEDVGFIYDTLNDMPKLSLPSGKEIRLSAGSSGFQSSLPLLLVSKNLTQMVLNSSKDAELSAKEHSALIREVEAVLSNPTLSEDVKSASLRAISSRFSYSRFVNIVEEMELNLFPDSQKGVLYELLASTYHMPANRLMLTTHSPYVINYLTLAIKAKQLSQQAQERPELLQRIYTIVPAESQIADTEVAIYEVAEHSTALLSCYNGIPSDDNFLNEKLNDSNLAFGELLEIEENLQ